MGNQQKKMNRRTFLKRLIAGMGWLMLVTGIDAFFWERRQLRRRDVPVPLATLPDGFDGFRIAHFTDVHLGHGLDADDLIPLIERINEAHPDIIVFTGDFVDDGMEEVEKAARVLSELHAPYGKYAILDNHDIRGGADPERIVAAYESAGFVPLVNRNVTIQHLSTGESIVLAGLDDYFREPDWDRTFQGIPAGACVLALIHEPDLADEAKRYGVSLQLSGHSHGGQVRFPLIGGLLYPPYGKKYSDGLQQVENSEMLVHTSRGIGTTILPVRFFCWPEWHILTLSKKYDRIPFKNL
jgi:predicted MPP superfamily phosphohydrolase